MPNPIILIIFLVFAISSSQSFAQESGSSCAGKPLKERLKCELENDKVKEPGTGIGTEGSVTVERRASQESTSDLAKEVRENAETLREESFERQILTRPTIVID